MACTSAFLLALLVAASQAAPQAQVQGSASLQTGSATAASGASSDSASGGASSSGTSSNTGTSTGSQASVVLPQISNLLPSFNFSSSSASANSQHPIAAIISLIPNVISAEGERINGAVQDLVSQQVGAAADSISVAAQTGGKLISNGVSVITSWPAFWAKLLG